MFEVRVYNRQDGSEIMRSELLLDLDEALDYQFSVGQGEGYYSVIMEPRATLEDLLERMGVDA